MGAAGLTTFQAPMRAAANPVNTGWKTGSGQHASFGPPSFPPFGGKGAGGPGGASGFGTQQQGGADALGGAASSPVPSALTGGPLVNTTADDPNLQEQVRRLAQRMSTDPTQRAIERSTTGTMDAAALGAADAGQADLSRRGLVGTGAGSEFLVKHFFEPAQREAAQSAADISLKREKDLDALVLGGQGIMSAPGQMGLANKELGLRQYQTQIGAQEAAVRLGLEQQRLAQEWNQQQIDNWLKTYAMSQGGASYAG